MMYIVSKNEVLSKHEYIWTCFTGFEPKNNCIVYIFCECSMYHAFECSQIEHVF